MPKKVAIRSLPEAPKQESADTVSNTPVVPANAVAPTSPAAAPVTRRKRTKKEAFDRGAYQYAVWTGAGAAPKFWAKDMDAVKAYLGGVKPSKLSQVHVGEIKSVKVETSIQIGPSSAE